MSTEVNICKSCKKVLKNTHTLISLRYILEGNRSFSTVMSVQQESSPEKMTM